jgi:hypothetical protein
MADTNNQWYYVLNNQQQGPVDETTIQQLLQNRVIDGNTLTWQAGMASWLPLRSTTLQALIPVTAPPPLTSAAPASAGLPPAMPYTQSYAPSYGQPMDAAKQDAQKKANTALTLSIIGIFCFSIIFGPIALVNAANAKKVLVSGDPGYGKATAAQIISWIAIAIWVLGIIIYIANAASGG